MYLIRVVFWFAERLGLKTRQGTIQAACEDGRQGYQPGMSSVIWEPGPGVSGLQSRNR